MTLALPIGGGDRHFFGELGPDAPELAVVGTLVDGELLELARELGRRDLEQNHQVFDGDGGPGFRLYCRHGYSKVPAGPRSLVAPPMSAWERSSGSSSAGSTGASPPRRSETRRRSSVSSSRMCLFSCAVCSMTRRMSAFSRPGAGSCTTGHGAMSGCWAGKVTNMSSSIVRTSTLGANSTSSVRL